MTGAAILALGAAFCFALALILTQFGLRSVPSWRSPLYSIVSSNFAAWAAAAVFVDWRGFDGRAAAIFAAVGRKPLLPTPAQAPDPDANRPI